MSPNPAPATDPSVLALDTALQNLRAAARLAGPDRVQRLERAWLFTKRARDLTAHEKRVER